MKKKVRAVEQCMTSNRGFTLVELLSGLTIFAFFTISLLQYMMTAATVNSQIGNAVVLETHAQVAMTTVEEYLIEVSAGVCFKDNTLYLINIPRSNESLYNNTLNKYSVHVFEFEETENQVVYYPGEVVRQSSSSSYEVGSTYEISYIDRTYSSLALKSNSEKEILVSNVIDFNVDLHMTETSGVTTIAEVQNNFAGLYAALDDTTLYSLLSGGSGTASVETTAISFRETTLESLLSTYNVEPNTITSLFLEEWTDTVQKKITTGSTVTVTDDLKNSLTELCEEFKGKMMNNVTHSLNNQLSSFGSVESVNVSFTMGTSREMQRTNPEGSFTKDLFIVLRNAPPLATLPVATVS